MTVEAVGTLQTQKQKENEFFTATLDDDGVKQILLIPRSKIIQNMDEYAEQLFGKEMRSLYIRRD